MDVLYFLKTRTAFIRQLHNVTTSPFMERKRKIENEEVPYVRSYFGDYTDDEPAFIDEWIEADESVQILGYSCISMLAASLKLYFIEWQTQLRVPIDKQILNSVFKQQGWLSGYKAYFQQQLGIPFENVPVNLEILEEVVIARNSVQHPQSITDIRTKYSEAAIKKLSSPFFLDESERDSLVDEDEALKSLIPPRTLHITANKLSTAIDEVEKFAEWFEVEINNSISQSTRPESPP